MLDYDSISPKLYDFNIFATDDGDIPKQGDAVIRIFIINLNDEKPVFPGNMSVDIFYNIDVNSDVYVVQATDADIGDVVTYRFQTSKFIYPYNRQSICFQAMLLQPLHLLISI